MDDPQGLEAYKDRCVTIDRHRIQDEFCEVSADLAFWSERRAVAEGDVVLAKARIAQVRAKVDEQVRSALQVRGDKVTESRVEILVDGSPDVAKAQADLASATEEQFRLRGIVESISVKSSMLMSLGAMVRQEMKSDPSIRE